ncbi:catalase [Sphingomonas sp. LY54]|uniref:catalase n=1 Tax=Sphingomonas sp. LY54 TaxID=3095343 RepID=UPI003A7F4185
MRIKFPDVIHSLKPDPVTFRQEPNRIFDFMSQTPESMKLLTHLLSPRGVPASYRHMEGFGVNTYKMVNEAGGTECSLLGWRRDSGPRVGMAGDTQSRSSTTYRLLAGIERSFMCRSSAYSGRKPPVCSSEAAATAWVNHCAVQRFTCCEVISRARRPR